MYKIKKYILVISMMLMVAQISLLAISMLAYLFKWHADKAMIGIIITYVLTGFLGGIFLRGRDKRLPGMDGKQEIGKKAIEVLLLSVVFMVLLVGISVLCMKETFEISIRFLIIFGLLLCSTFLGRIL